MSKINGKKLVSATMHQNIFFPGIGEIKKELTSVFNGMNKTVDLVVDEPFVIIGVKDKGNKTISIPVPLTNFSHLVLSDDV